MRKISENDGKRMKTTVLVGGLEHFLFFHILGIIIPIDFHIFQRGRSTTNRSCVCAFRAFSKCFVFSQVVATGIQSVASVMELALHNAGHGSPVTSLVTSGCQDEFDVRFWPRKWYNVGISMDNLWISMDIYG